MYKRVKEVKYENKVQGKETICITVGIYEEKLINTDYIVTAKNKLVPNQINGHDNVCEILLVTGDIIDVYGWATTSFENDEKIIIE